MRNSLQSITKTHLIVLAAVILLILGIGYWLTTQFYWAEEEIDHGFSKAAMQNDFLAAKHFLQKHGIPVSVVKNLTLIDKGSWRNIPLKPNDTIIMINGYKTWDENSYAKISQWIESGGTLIMSPQNPFVGAHTDQNDIIFDALDVKKVPEKAEKKVDFLDELSESLKKQEKELEDKKQKKIEENKTITDKEKSSTKTEEQQQLDSKNEKKKENDIEQKKQKKKKYQQRCGHKKEATAINFKSQSKPLLFDFSREDPFIYHDYDHLDDDGNPKERSEHLLYFPWEEGSVSVLSDTTIWSNKRIDCQDHAFALWSLVNLNGRVWFLINQDAPSLSVIIWRKAPYALLACVLALILWLWTKSQALGPVFKQSTMARRSLTEHVYATGVLLWRKFQSPLLLVILRKDILTILVQRHSLPGDDESDQSEQKRLEFLHELTGLPQDALKHALFAEGIHEPQDLLRVISHLQLIRKKI